MRARAGAAAGIYLCMSKEKKRSEVAGVDRSFARVLCTPELAGRLRMPLYSAGYDMDVCRFDRRMIPDAAARGQADVVIVNALMAGLDVYALAGEIAARPSPAMPALLAIFPAGCAKALAAARRAGVVCMSDREASDDRLVERVRALALADRLSPAWAGRRSVESRLRLLGVALETAGGRYLAKAIVLCARDYRCFGRLSTQVYPMIAREYGAGSAAVERLMRYAIESAWLRGDIEMQYTIFGNTVDASKGKPTNSEFIAQITEALRLEANT
mgnify:CR=1 FL=1